MRVYILADGRPTDSHLSRRLQNAILKNGWHQSVMAQNGCTEDDLKEQCRIVLEARRLGLMEEGD